MRQTLKQLQQREEIIIKRADKGSYTVIEDKKTYIRDCADLLSDKTYEETKDDHRWETYHTIQQLSFDAYANRVIDRNTHKFLLQQFDTIKTAEFYGLRKIHKTPTTLRPIIAGHSSPTARLSRVLDHYLQPIVTTSKSYVRDSKQFIQILDKTTFPRDILLIAADVTSLYTSIPQQEGINAVCKAMDGHYHDSWLTAFTREGLRIILKENYFQFTDKSYRQIHGTAMGTPVTPSFANIFMTDLETTFMANETTTPTHWFRYIDDIFLTWTQDRTTLDSFMNRLNNHHCDIKFTWTTSDTETTFLDVDLYKGKRFQEDGTLDTKTHYKTTNTFQYLHSTSYHPGTTKKSVCNSELIRFIRNTSDRDNYEQQKTDHFRHLSQRGYKPHQLEKWTRDINHDRRQEYLRDTTKNTSAWRPVFSTLLQPGAHRIKDVIKRHWEIIENNTILNDLFPTRPIVAYRRGKNLGQSLTRSKVRTTTKENENENRDIDTLMQACMTSQP